MLQADKNQQGLGYQIRREEEHNRKSQAAIEKSELRIVEREEQILQLQEQVRAERELQQPREQRFNVVVQRLAWLAMQKAKESMPDAFMQRVRAANAAVATMEDHALALVRELLGVLVPPPEELDITLDDSSEGTAELMRQDETENREGFETYEEHAPDEVLRARARLAAAQR